MPTCDLCSSIPWQTLPSLPPDRNFAFPDWSGDRDLLYLWEETDPSQGFPHHAGLPKLELSAASCGLCQLLLPGVNKLLERHRQASHKSKTSSIKRHEDPELNPADIHLWLFQRVDGGDGMLVLLSAPDLPDVYVVSAVGIGADDGRNEPWRSFAKPGADGIV